MTAMVAHRPPAPAAALQVRAFCLPLLVLLVLILTAHAPQPAGAQEADEPPPDCHDFGTPTSCTAAPGCGWCAGSYTCMEGDTDGPSVGSVGCACDAWCGASGADDGSSTYQACLDDAAEGALLLSLAPKAEVEVPPEVDVRCANGGARTWFVFDDCSSPPCNEHNEFVPVFGSAMCDCAGGWAGMECNICTDDSLCTEKCNHFINPEASVLSLYLLEFGHRVAG